MVRYAPSIAFIANVDLTKIIRTKTPHPARELVSYGIGNKLKEMIKDNIHPDVLTFAGNGEPTSHPHFAEIIDDTIRLRDKYCPQAKDFCSQ